MEKSLFSETVDDSYERELITITKDCQLFNVWNLKGNKLDEMGNIVCGLERS